MSKPLQILIISDSTGDVDLILLALKRGNFEVTHQLVDSDQAMDTALEQKTWDLIISGYDMAKFHGLDALELYQEKGLDIPFLIVSEDIGQELAVAALKAGVHDFIVMDNLARLVPAVKRELQEAHLRRLEHQAQETLRQSEAKYREMLEHVPIGLYCSSPSGKILDANPALADLLASPNKHFLMSHNLTDLFVDPQDHRRLVDILTRQGIVSGREVRFKRFDGISIWVETTVRAISDDDGSILYYEGSIQDITERKNAAQSLLESEERFRRLLQASFEGVFITSQGKIVDVNKQFAKMLGYERAELIGRPVIDLIAPESRELVAKYLKTGYEEPYEHFAIRKDGAIFPVEVHTKSISLAGGTARVTVVKDITARKQAQEALQYHRDFERLVTSISTRFIFVPSDRIDVEIQRALHEIGQFAGVDRSYIWLVSEDLTTATRTYEWSVQGLQPIGKILNRLSQEKFPWMAQNILTGKDTRISSVADLPLEARAEKRLFQSWGVKSIINVPLIFQGNLLGILGLQTHFKEREWSQETVTILRIVGDVFANALERKQAEKEIQNHLARLEAIREIELSILATQSPANIALTALERIQVLLPYNLGGVVLYDFDANQVEFLATYAVGQDISPLIKRSYTIDEFTPYVDTLRTGQIYIMPDLAAEKNLDVASELLIESGIRSFIDVPLIVRGDLIGSFSILSDQPNAFESLHIDIAREVANSLALSIQQARLLETEKQRRNELETLEQFSMSLRQADTRTELVSILLLETRSLFDADAGVILTPFEDKFEYTIIQGPRKIKSLLNRQRFAEDELVKFITAQDPVFLPDLPYEMVGVESAIFLPLKFKQQTYGAIILYWFEHRDFSPEERHMLNTIADMAGIALERMHILENLEVQVSDRTHELTTLYELTALLAAESDLIDTLNQTLERLLKSINSLSGAIHIMDEEHNKLDLVSHQGIDSETVSSLKSIESDHVLWQQLVERQEPLLLMKIAEKDLITAGIHDLKIKHYIGAPIQTGKKTLGIISAFYTSDHDPSLDEISLLNLVADQIGIAVERTNLREQAKQAAIMAERQRLARELHDAVTQSLYSITFLAKASRNFANSREWEQAKQHLGNLQDTAQQALKEMRLLIYELLPTSLEEQGLTSLLRHRLESVEQRAGVEVEFLATGSFDLPTEVQLDVYRIAQEALNNILKHAAATKVKVQMFGSEQGLEMTIEDNGAGFDPQQISGGLGLDSMLKRAEKLGGVLTITSDPGRGTLVRLTMDEVKS